MHAPPNLQNPTALARGGARKWIGLDGLINEIVAEEATDQQAICERTVGAAGAASHLAVARSLPIVTRWAATANPEASFIDLGVLGAVR